MNQGQVYSPVRILLPGFNLTTTCDIGKSATLFTLKIKLCKR